MPAQPGKNSEYVRKRSRADSGGTRRQRSRGRCLAKQRSKPGCMRSLSPVSWRRCWQTTERFRAMRLPAVLPYSSYVLHPASREKTLLPNASSAYWQIPMRHQTVLRVKAQHLIDFLANYARHRVTSLTVCPFLPTYQSKFCASASTLNGITGLLTTHRTSRIAAAANSPKKPGSAGQDFQARYTFSVRLDQQ